MTVKEIMNKNSFKNVFNKIYSIYLSKEGNDRCVEMNLGFRKAWRELLNKKGEKSEFKIHLVEAVIEDKDFIDVCLYDEDEDELYAVDFYPWDKLINSEIIHPENMSHVEALAHVLWELTFWGFSADAIDKQAEEMGDSECEFVEFDLKNWKL